jgi:hypothetical protein
MSGASGGGKSRPAAAGVLELLDREVVLELEQVRERPLQHAADLVGVRPAVDDQAARDVRLRPGQHQRVDRQGRRPREERERQRPHVGGENRPVEAGLARHLLLPREHLLDDPCHLVDESPHLRLGQQGLDVVGRAGRGRRQPGEGHVQETLVGRRPLDRRVGRERRHGERQVREIEAAQHQHQADRNSEHHHRGSSVPGPALQAGGIGRE